MKLFIFGSTGDLIKRKVVPAFSLMDMPDLEIIALGRKDLTHEDYHDFVCESGMCFDHLKEKPKYSKVNFEDEIKCEKCLEHLDKIDINFFYSAMPPKSTEIILKYIGELKHQGLKVKVLIEKPFGYNLENAKLLKKVAEEENLFGDIFISDHYLFKKEVGEIVKRDFKKLKIVSLESVGLEKRIGYYDEIGALKDMIQSHFFNIAFKLVDNPEEEFKDFEIVSLNMGQYGNGNNDGYVKELGKKSDTETFVNLKIKTKTKEFEFITGKKFDKKVGFIQIDDKKIEFGEDNHSYKNLFLDFFAGKKEVFTTIDDSILAWEIIKKVEENKPNLEYYKENSKVEDVLISK